ncbi:MAG: glycoside hydrolase [Chloroflexia bacterium]|nr:glycoside hydrolase [Chloroflexia bacterium]
MARIKLAYIGGGSTRGPGTMASLIAQGEQFQGSEVILIDLNQERLDLVRTIAEKMARCAGVDLTISTTTDRRAGLTDCDAVLTSYRPGGFEARYLDESIPLKHGVIGQETQGPGGFFMALRSIHVMQGIIADMEVVCPSARLFNYTNPVNIVAEAVSHQSAIPIVSLCEGPLLYPHEVVAAADLDPAKLDAVSVGLNHGSWTVRHLYQGEDAIALLRDAYALKRDDPSVDQRPLRLLALAAMMGTIPSQYFQYYYFKDEVLAELRAKPTTRSQDIMAAVPDYWAHYREQASRDCPVLDPALSRGGINELELAIDVMDGIFNDRREVWPVNVPNRGAVAGLPDDLVVECLGYVDAAGIAPIAAGPLPPQVAGLVEMLGAYQALAAKAAWEGSRREAIQALATNPLCFSLPTAEAIYDELAAAHRDYLPDRLLRN